MSPALDIILLSEILSQTWPMGDTRAMKQLLVGQNLRRFGLRINSLSPNAVRLSILSGLIGLVITGVVLSAFTSCKSTTKNIEPSVAAAKEPASAVAATPASQPAVVLPLSPSDPAGEIVEADSDATSDDIKIAGIPVVGLEAWQDEKPVTTIVTGKQVQFRPTDWTRDTNTANGCAVNPGIVQASWTVGSKPSADVQRFAGQDCRPLDYNGMFTKEGSITVRLDVLSAEGEVASAEKTFSVKN